MPKYASPTAMKLIQQKTGTAPFIAVKVVWSVIPVYYVTRDIGQIPGVPQGYFNNIMEVGAIRNEKRSDSMCNVGSVRLKFSDTDGMMKSVIDAIQAENCPASVFLGFEDTSALDWIELITGRTVGPFVWDEEARTLEFEIETHVHSHEIGFAATYADFDDLNHNAAGVPWPMIFGKCAHVPALFVRQHAVTYLQCSLRFYHVHPLTTRNNGDDIIMQGNPDTYCFVEDNFVKNVLYVENATRFPKNKPISIIINDIVFVGKFVDNVKFVISESNAPRYKNIPVVGGPANDPDFNNPQVIWIGQIKMNGQMRTPPLANHHCYFNNPNGKEWYNYCVQQIDNKCWFRFPFKDPNPPFAKTKPRIITEAYAITKCGLVDDVAADHQFMKDAAPFRKKNVGAHNFGELLARINKFKNDGSSWWSIPMDADVRLWNELDPDIYVASLSPLTEVKAVWGKRRVPFGEKTRIIMQEIPESYYTISTANYNINGLRATGILFYTPLKDYAGQDWQEDVYVSATGAIGPQPTDIIKWMITNYTDLFCDLTMFKIAHDKLSDTHANFALFDKRDALKLSQEIAFQSRCALLLDSGGLGIVYLPYQPAQQWDFDETDTKETQLHFTERKDIVTKFIGTYTETYKDKHHLSFTNQMNIRQFERVLRSLIPTQTRSRSEIAMYIYVNNVNRYGLHTREEAAYIFNDYKYVKKFCEFWGFRFSNSWRLVRLQTFLQGVRLQPFDGVLIDFADTTILNANGVFGVVESVEFDPNNFVTTIIVALPIVAGSLTPETRYWPG